jgi:hypothetical protein
VAGRAALVADADVEVALLELVESVVTVENAPDEVELFKLLEPVDVVRVGIEVLPGFTEGMVSTVLADPSPLLHRGNVRGV